MPVRDRRPHGRRLSIAVSLLLAGAVGLGYAHGAGASTACLNDVEAPDRWHRIPLPAARVVSLVQLEDEPCDLVAADARQVWVSDDGGRSWTPTYEPPADRTIARLFAEGMGPRQVVLAFEPAFPADGALRTDTGLLLSRDAGRAFVHLPAPGVTNMDVVAATGTPVAGGQEVHFAAQAAPPRGALPRVPPAAGMVFSGHFGKTEASIVEPQQGSAVALPSRVAVDPIRRITWVSDAAPRTDQLRLWRSTDPQTYQDVQAIWEPVVLPAPGRVHDLSFALHLARGEINSAVLVAGEFGLLRSVDDGASWQVGYGGAPVTAVRVEKNRPDTVMAVVGGRPRRGTVPGALQPADAGLPGDCAAAALSGDAPGGAGTTTFVLSCGDTGYFRYRASALAGETPSSPAPTLPGFVPPSATPPTVVPPTASPPPGGVPLALPMTPLATIALPSVDTVGGNIAFDGRTVYYTAGDAGSPTSREDIVIHRVTAATGAVQPDLVVRVGELAGGPDWIELSADVRRQLLYVRTTRGAKAVAGKHYLRMLAYSLRTGAVTVLFDHIRDAAADDACCAGFRFNYDPSIDQFAMGIEMGTTVRHYDRHGHPTDDGCSWQGYDYIAAVVAVGDGGGLYLQMEDDSTFLRLDRNCRLVAAYSHRTFSEPRMENDAMACDGVTFGVPAVWIRDAELRSATAYAVPFGFCPLAQAVPPPTRPRPGIVPVPVEPVPAPIPQPQPNPNPNPVQQPAPQVQPQPQPHAQAQAQAQPQAQQQVQQQAQQQLQGGVVPQRQSQPQAAAVGVQSRTAQEEYAMRRRRPPLPAPMLGGMGLLMLATYGFALSRRWQDARQHAG